MFILVVAVATAMLWLPPQPTIPTPPDEADDPATELRVLRLIAMALVTHDAVEGRRSLAEAAALFGVLRQLPPAVSELSLLSQFDGVPTEEERLCRNLIVWADNLAGPDRSAGLKAELNWLQAGGPIRLPDPALLESADELLTRARCWREAVTPRVYGTSEP
jgi:hypothetical protein